MCSRAKRSSWIPRSLTCRSRSLHSRRKRPEARVFQPPIPHKERRFSIADGLAAKPRIQGGALSKPPKIFLFGDYKAPLLVIWSAISNRRSLFFSRRFG